MLMLEYIYTPFRSSLIIYNISYFASTAANKIAWETQLAFSLHMICLSRLIEIVFQSSDILNKDFDFTSTPLTPLGIFLKSSFPNAFWLALNVQLSVPVHSSSPHASCWKIFLSRERRTWPLYFYIVRKDMAYFALFLDHIIRFFFIDTT